MKNQDREQLANLLAETQLLTHKVITCGVIADHPDATLGDKHPYSTEWNSQQADRVRGLRKRHDALREAATNVCHALETMRERAERFDDRAMEYACRGMRGMLMAALANKQMTDK